MKSNQLTRICHGVCAFSLGVATTMTANWNDRIQAGGGGTPPAWVSGVAFPMLDGGQGYGLVADSEKTIAGGVYPIVSAARFDAQGNEVWAAYLDTGAGASEQELLGTGESLDTLFAGFINDSGSAVVSMINGDDLSPVFAHQVALTAAPDKTSLFHFPGSLSAVLQDIGNGFRLLVIDGEGARVFENDYTSSAFEGGGGGGLPGIGGIPGFGGTRTITATALSDQSGIVVTVHIAEQVIGGTPIPSISNQNTLSTICLNPDGSVRWANKLEFNTGGILTLGAGTAEGSTILYRGMETGVDMGTFQPVSRSHLIKFNGDGSFGWATTVEGALLPAVNFSPDGDYWLSGTRTTTTDPPSIDVVVARVDVSTGALETQAILDGDTFDAGFLGGVSADRVFVSMVSGANPESLLNQAATVIALDHGLQLVGVKQYKDSAIFAPLFYSRTTDDLLFSPFKIGDNQLEALSLDSNLNTSAGCDLFVDGQVDVSNSGLTGDTLAVSPDTITVSVAARTTAFTETTVPVSALTLESESICEDGGNGGDPTAPALTLRRNADGDGLELTFASETGVNYTVKRSDSVNGTYATEATLQGSGAVIVYSIDADSSDAAFYYVEAAKP